MESRWLPIRDLKTCPQFLIEGRIPVSLSDPWYDGHFPEIPIFPGVALMAYAEAALREGTQGFGIPQTVSGLSKIRFRELVKPGADLSFTLTKKEPESLQWKCAFRQLDVPICGGIVESVELSADLSPASVAPISEPEPSSQVLLVSEILPHLPPMGVVEKVLDVGKDWGAASGTVNAQWPVADSDSLPAILLVEFAAQTAAVYIGVTYKTKRVGFLVGIQHARFLVRQVPLGTPLWCHVVITRQVGEYAVFHCFVATGMVLLAELDLQVYFPPRELGFGS